jgi:RNA polymerase sigma-70 factor (ECF subfamily)
MELGPSQIAGPDGVERDADLWQRCATGDGEAFGLLFDRHRERVFRHACRLAASRQDAEDLVATAFLELWRLRDRVRMVDGSVLPWLLATTTNLGLNARRARRRYQRLLERLPRAGSQPDAASVALEAHGLGIDGRLRAGLQSLQLRDAQLLVLVALEGYSVVEAAACLQMSEPAARARLHRARSRLGEQLSGEAIPQRLAGQEDVR